MRMAVVGAVALLVCGCACACGSESEVEPRTPVNAQVTEPTCVAAPALQDGFPEAFARSQVDDPYRVERARSVDLGAIGDGPLNEQPVPHHLAAWEQPFPCDWTNTCRPVVVCPWGAARPSL